MVMEHIRMAVRVAVELALGLLGLFDLRPQRAPAPPGRRRIAFQVYSEHLAQAVEPVVAELRRGGDVDIFFVILPHPHFPIRSWWATRAFVRRKLGVPPDHIRFFWQTLWLRYDLVVFSDVYARFPPRRTRRALLLHGPGLQHRFFVKSRLRKTLEDFDAVLVNGPGDAELVRSRLGGEPPFALHAAGFPFLDGLVRGAVPEGYHRRLGLDPARKTVLFAPHWTALERIHDADSDYFSQVLAALSGLDANLVVKLHACSYNRAMSAGVDWRPRLAALSAAGGVAIDEDPDDRPALGAADVLISDLSSRIFNFFLLGKPVVHFFPFELGGDELDARRFELLRQGSLVADSAAELRGRVEEVLRGGGDRRPGDAVARRCFAHPGGAAAEVVRILRRELAGGAA